MGEVMAPDPGGSPFRARWDATSVSLYSVVNEPGGLFFPSPCIPHFFQILQPVGGNFFSGKVPLPLYSTLFSRLDEKNIKLFCRKTVGTLLALIIESKISFTKSFFGQRKRRKRKPDRLIPVGALGKRFAAQRKNGRSLCCSFSVFLYILSLV